MQSFDGTLLWTYGLRTETIGQAEALKVDVIAFGPLGQTLEVLNVQPVGKHPSTNAWTPDGRYSWVLHEGDNHVILMEAHPPFRQLKRIEVGASPLNVSFRPDGKYAYVTVGGLNAVAVIDTATMKAETMLPAGRTPSGMVLLNVQPRLWAR